MKVKFTVDLYGKEHEEIVEVNEKDIEGEGHQPTYKMLNLLNNWVDNQIGSTFQIVEDERFSDELFNLPYVDWVTKQRLGWK